MEYFVYILHSKSLNKHYIRCTSNIDTRLELHLNPSKDKFTYRADDWQFIRTIKCISKKQALAIEKHIKSMKSKVYILNLIQYPEMETKLKAKYDC